MSDLRRDIAAGFPGGAPMSYVLVPSRHLAGITLPTIGQSYPIAGVLDGLATHVRSVASSGEEAIEYEQVPQAAFNHDGGAV